MASQPNILTCGRTRIVNHLLVAMLPVASMSIDMTNDDRTFTMIIRRITYNFMILTVSFPGIIIDVLLINIRWIIFVYVK